MDPTSELKPPNSISSAPSHASQSGHQPPPIPSLPPPAFSFKDANMDVILEDLSSRFILNLPDHELSSVERVCFQVEQAHWYYEDFIRQENRNLPSMALRAFSAKLFAACPLLQRWSHRHEEAFADFVKYKTSVPVCGAILLNSAWDKCVLVKGWKSSAPWGFPRGKINENEPLYTCAAREVLEETGYNCEDKILEEAQITLQGKDQQFVTIYVVPNVPEDFPFNTRTRKEISKIDWFLLNQLPGWNGGDDDEYSHHHRGHSQNNQIIRTWSVSSFLSQLRNKLYEFQAMFGYMPPGLTPRQLKEYKRAKRAVANRMEAHPPARATRSRYHANVLDLVSHTSASEGGLADEESTGAEGDDEPETDHDPGHLHGNSGSSQSSNDINTPATSAVDALFTRSIIAADANASSPDIQGVSPARKVVKAKSAKAPRGKNVVPAAEPARQAPQSSAAERERFNSLMETLAISSHATSEASGTSNMGMTSGLPTPADSPITSSSVSNIDRPKGVNSHPPPKAAKPMANGTKPAQKVTGEAQPSKESPDGSLPKSIFEFVSPFDALTSPTVTNKKPKVPPTNPNPPVTILKRPTAGPGQKTASNANKAVPATLDTTSFDSASSSSSMEASSSPPPQNDRKLRVVNGSTTPYRDVISPSFVAPETINGPSRERGYSVASNVSIHPPRRAPTPENTVHMTPKAKVPPVVEDDTPDHAQQTPVRTNSYSLPPSASSSHTPQHLALLDMVANEVEAISSLSTCPTPQPNRTGLPLPPMQEREPWGGLMGPPASSNPNGPFQGVHTSNIGLLPKPVQDILYSTGERIAPPMDVPSSNGTVFPPSNASNVFSNQLPNPPIRNVPVPPPYLHHPHPLLHPQQQINIPSASPSPHLVSPASQRRETISNTLVNAATNKLGTAYGNGTGPLGHVRSMSQVPSNLQGMPIGPPTPGDINSLTQRGGPMYTQRNGSILGAVRQVNGRPVLSGLQPVSQLQAYPPRPASGPMLGYTHLLNGGMTPSPLAASHANLANPLRAPIPPPNPNSFVVQKSQTDRAELLNIITSRSPPRPVANTPLAATAPLPAHPLASAPAFPKSVLESGLIPSNVQFRAMAKAATSGNITSPSK
ncbi:mRNA-decapping enzyme subunit 2 [Tulasnella sp. 403]|nr:mRNA-decapping enzyme subunit 2 [Tulasnella sp. 403]